MKQKIPYINLFGGSVVITAIIFMAMEVFMNDLNLGNLGIFLTIILAIGFIFFQNYLIAKNLSTD